MSQPNLAPFLSVCVATFIATRGSALGSGTTDSICARLSPLIWVRTRLLEWQHFRVAGEAWHSVSCHNEPRGPIIIATLLEPLAAWHNSSTSQPLQIPPARCICTLPPAIRMNHSHGAEYVSYMFSDSILRFFLLQIEVSLFMYSSTLFFLSMLGNS